MVYFPMSTLITALLIVPSLAIPIMRRTVAGTPDLEPDIFPRGHSKKVNSNPLAGRQRPRARKDNSQKLLRPDGTVVLRYIHPNGRVDDVYPQANNLQFDHRIASYTKDGLMFEDHQDKQLKLVNRTILTLEPDLRWSKKVVQGFNPDANSTMAREDIYKPLEGGGYSRSSEFFDPNDLKSEQRKITTEHYRFDKQMSSRIQVRHLGPGKNMHVVAEHFGADGVRFQTVAKEIGPNNEVLHEITKSVAGNGMMTTERRPDGGWTHDGKPTMMVTHSVEEYRNEHGIKQVVASRLQNGYYRHFLHEGGDMHKNVIVGFGDDGEPRYGDFLANGKVSEIVGTNPSELTPMPQGCVIGGERCMKL